MSMTKMAASKAAKMSTEGEKARKNPDVVGVGFGPKEKNGALTGDRLEEAPDLQGAAPTGSAGEAQRLRTSCSYSGRPIEALPDTRLHGPFCARRGGRCGLLQGSAPAREGDRAANSGGGPGDS